MKAQALLVFALASSVVACASEPRPEPRVEANAAPVCAPQKSEADTNKAALLKLNQELWDKRNPDAALNGTFAADMVNHAAIPEAQGAEGMRGLTRKLFAAFPDLTVKTEDIVAEGDRVIMRATFEGTQTGALEFKHPLPASGKHMRIEQIHSFRFKDGKIVETWMTMDKQDLMKQLSPAAN